VSPIPPDAIMCLDDAIEILKDQHQVAACGFDLSDMA